MAYSKVILNGNTLMDTTDKTVDAGSMLSGITALKNDGTTATGTIQSRTASDLTASGATVTVPAGNYASQATKSVATGTEGTPTATKGAVSNHSVTVTPSVTNTAGYISGGTKTGTGVSVNVTELESGTKSITENGTGISVSGFSAVDVNVSGGTPNIQSLSVTQNGTYTASGGVDGYSPVTVNVSGGGGVTPAPAKQINFIDYDGTIVYSYTKAEITAMTSESDLPANPSHSGLTAQGWNWTLAQIKAQLTALPDAPVWVGQMYITTSGDTEIDVIFPDSARLSPILSIAVNGTITVDWGDNTTADTVTGTSLTSRQAVPHTYASTGSYMMKIHVVSGSFAFYESSSNMLLRKNTTSNQNRVYANCIRAVRLGSGITSVGPYAFYYCQSLASITIPSGVTSIEGSAFYYCYSLASITIPSDVTSIGASIFYNCYSLASIAIPSGSTSIGDSAFYNCYALASVTIPSGVTSITNSAFPNCASLASIAIPSGVTSIGNSVFSNCYGVAEYHIKPTTPPTLGTNAFSNIVSDCVIYVPSASLSTYKGTTNWSTYASYMVGE